MSNLIITVIGIFLAIIASIVGIYYGGQAYQNAQAKATAETMIQQASQLEQALHVWSADNGGNTTLPDPSYADDCRIPASNALVTGGYISQIPGLSFASRFGSGSPVVNFSAGSWGLGNGLTNHCATTSTCCTPSTALEQTFIDMSLDGSVGFPGVQGAAQICTEINNIAGISGIPTLNISDMVSSLAGHKFGCQQNGAVAGIYIFVYKVF